MAALRSFLLPCLIALTAGGCAAVKQQPDDREAKPCCEGPSPPGSLRISPDPVLVVTIGEEQRVPLTVLSSTDGDVTRSCHFALGAASLGEVRDGVLTVRAGLTQGMRTTLTATWGQQRGTVQVIVKRLAPDLTDGQTPRGVEAYFAGGEGGPVPAWVYPLSGAIMPWNVGPMRLQFSAAPGAVVHRIQIECSTYAQTLYLGVASCAGTECRHTLGGEAWLRIARSCAGDAATLRLSASAGIGEKTGSDAPIRLEFSSDELKGVLYHLSSSIKGLERWPAGSGPSVGYVRNGSGFGCAGCHSPSRDGRRVATSFTFNFGGPGGVLDGRNGQKFVLKPPEGESWDFSSFSPSGDMLLVNRLGEAWIIDPTTGDRRYTLPQSLVGGAIIQPHFSPDGQSIVFVRAPLPLPGDDATARESGDIMLMPFNGGRFAAPELIVAARPGVEYHFFPSFTPDSRFILFTTARVPCRTDGAPCSTYLATNTFLQIVRASAGNTPVPLLRARQKAGLGSNWPRAVPSAQDGGRLLFFTFHSRARYGFEKTNDRLNLWMSALDLNKLERSTGEDPSFVPFWLPFQRPDDENLLGSWTTELFCDADLDCPSDHTCREAKCVPKLK